MILLLRTQFDKTKEILHKHHHKHLRNHRTPSSSDPLPLTNHTKSKRHAITEDNSTKPLLNRNLKNYCKQEETSNKEKETHPEYKSRSARTEPQSALQCLRTGKATGKLGANLLNAERSANHDRSKFPPSQLRSASPHYNNSWAIMQLATSLSAF